NYCIFSGVSSFFFLLCWATMYLGDVDSHGDCCGSVTPCICKVVEIVSNVLMIGWQLMCYLGNVQNHWADQELRNQAIMGGISASLYALTTILLCIECVYLVTH